MRRWQVLEGLIRKHGWTDGAELGVLKGETFLYLLAACEELNLTGVDSFKFMDGMVYSDGGKAYKTHDWDKYRASIESSMKIHGDRAKLLVMTTTEGAALVEDRSLDFVFIDADHSLLGVLRDIMVWQRKLKPTGWIVGHDTHFPTVRAVIDIVLPGWIEHDDHVWSIPLSKTCLASRADG